VRSWLANPRRGPNPLQKHAKVTPEYPALRPGLRRIIDNLGWLVFDRILRMALGLVVGAWVARYLGPAQFGLYSYVTAFVSLFSIAATLGLDKIVVRDVVMQPDAPDEIVGTAFLLKLGGGVGTLLLALGAMYLLHPHDKLGLWLVGIVAGATVFRAFEVIDFWCQSQLLSKYSVYAGNAALVVVSAIKVALVMGGASLLAFAWSDLVGALVTAGGLVVAYRLAGQSIQSWRATRSRARKLLADSWPAMLAGLAIMIYLRIDQVMLREILGNEEVGIYSAAARISEVWYFVPMAICASVFPSILRAKIRGEAIYYQRLQQLFSLMSALALSIVIPMTILSRGVVVLIFGERYAEAGPVLAIHIWAAVFVFWGVAQEHWNVAEGFLRNSLYRTVAGAVMNVVLNLVLIPSHGSVGAAIATVVSYGVATIGGNLFNPRTRRIFVLQVKSLLFPRYLRGMV